MLLSVVAGAQEQQLFWDADQHVLSQAQAKADAGDWKSARAILENAFTQCKSNAEKQDKSCPTKVRFALGYFSQKQSDVRLAERTALLADASQQYMKILQVDPKHGPTLANLALVRQAQQNNSEAISLLQAAIAVDPMHIGRYQVLLGDLYLQEKQLESALEAYQAAATTDRGAEIPRLRIINTYRQLPMSKAEDLLKLAATWEVEFPDAARNAYETFIVKAHSSQSEAADRALTRLTSLLAREERISREAFQTLPRDWHSQAVDGLRSFLELPCGDISTGNWWLGSQDRREVFAEVALAAGSALIEDARARADCWEKARGFAPQMGNASLDLKRELALLYARTPQLDPDGHKLQQLVEQLVVEKGSAIESGDLEAEQRYHSALGWIFLEKGRWVSAGFDNADYQFHAAIDTGQRRFQRSGFYQPMPELRLALAKHYAENGEQQRATREYIFASEAYLDSDDLRQAEGALEKTQSPSGGWQEDAFVLHRLIELREGLKYSPGDPRRTGIRADDLPTRLQWLYKPTENVKDDFLKRQRFKIFADYVPVEDPAVKDWLLGLGAKQLEELEKMMPAPLVDPAAEAFVLVVNEHVAFVGVADLNRWERVEPRVLGEVAAMPTETQVLVVSASTNAVPHSVSFAMPNTSNPLLLKLSDQAVLTASAIKTVGPEQFYAVRPYLQFEGDKLYGTNSPRYETKIPRDNPWVSSTLQKLQSSGIVTAFH
jgi:hypothetical protein